MLRKKSVGSVGIVVGEEFIHLQLLYFKADEFHLHIPGKRMRAAALRCYVVGELEGLSSCHTSG